jgi:formate hydrogenlyase subunit 3/multisubunit Na+/H+ antiporter MnhD subunit
MIALGVGLLSWLLGAGAAFVLRRRRVAAVIGVSSAVAGGVAIGLAGARALVTGGAETWSGPWNVPAGALAFRLDPLAAVFLLPLAVVGALCAVYGVAYLRHHTPRTMGGSLAAYNLLLASMGVVVTANNVVLFLIAWELMTLSSWVLVVSDHELAAVRAAGRLYLIAGHIATAALVLMTILLAGGEAAHGMRTLLFLLMLVGFGTKAGIVPMHVWLPDAHPAAPSHVSALMSAVMITMGFYGLARFLPMLGPPALWWAYLLMTLGAVGAASGVVFAIAQEDVKRSLAYSTIENAGIATFAMGLGLLATALGQPLLAGLAWTAVLLHLWNHALAKALVFLGFGAVAQGAHTRRLDALGGMLARWRTVGATLILGAGAIASLPGLNVFTSEWLVLRGLVLGVLTLKGAPLVAMLVGLGALALTGGVAITCFTRLVGIGLLGAPRTAAAATAVEPGWAMRAPMLALAAGCLALAVLPMYAAGALAPAVLTIAPGVDVAGARVAVQPLAMLLPLIAVLAGVVLIVRIALGRPGLTRRSATWACGYAHVRPSMEYTGTSFSEPLTRLADPLLHMRIEYSSERARWTSSTPDRALVGFYEPVFTAVGRAGGRVRRLASPRITTSILLIVLTVLALVGLLFL